MSQEEIDEKYRTLIREELTMLENNLDHFNAHALQFIDIDDVRKKISDIRWYISHNYFEKGRPRPDKKDGKSNPPLPYLYSKIHGETSPLSHDIGICVQPVVENSLVMEQAARRIYNAVTYSLYGYITPEAAKADQEAAYKRKVLDKLDAKRHAEYEKQRREKKREVKTWDPDEWLKKKNKQREDARRSQERREAEAIRRFEEDTKRLKRSGDKT